MQEGHYQITYRPMPPQARFGFLTRPLHDESCYTQQELQLRNTIISARTHSGLDAELLRTEVTWFSDNNQVALVNVNEGSWIFGNEYRPRHTLSRNDFHIGLANRQLYWPALNTMTRSIGDYLLIRNNNLDDRHLNQPLNFVLLDAVQILNRLAVIHDGRYVNKQVQLLNKYLREIETHVSPTLGSDRLFLADCRYTLEHRIAKEIRQKLESQQLRQQFEQVKHQLNRVAELRHTVLHFALAENPVNPHPYWEHFSLAPENSNGKQEFPTLAAKECGEHIVDALSAQGSSQLSQLRMTSHTLSHCPHLNLLNRVSPTTQTAYGQSITDLQEVLRFQHILDSLVQLFEQAGEVFTLIQFRQQMNNLLTGIEHFIQQSEHHIASVIEANSKLYHQLIQDKQDLSWWKRVMSKKVDKIDNFIRNQDNLARFPTSISDLNLASKELLDGIHEVLNHLKQQGTETQQIAMISSTRELVQHLMDSMHAWVGHQHEINGLPAPVKPALLITTEEESQSSSIPNTLPLEPTAKLDEREPLTQISSANSLSPSLLFWSQSQSAPLQSCPPNQICTVPALTDNAPTGQSNHSNSSHPSPQQDIPAAMILGTVLLLPVVLIALKLLYDAWNAPKPQKSSNDKARFNQLAIESADLLSAINHLIPEDEEFKFIEEEFELLKAQAQKSQRYDVEAMRDLLDNLQSMLSDLNPNIARLSS